MRSNYRNKVRNSRNFAGTSSVLTGQWLVFSICISIYSYKVSWTSTATVMVGTAHFFWKFSFHLASYFAACIFLLSVWPLFHSLFHWVSLYLFHLVSFHMALFSVCSVFSNFHLHPQVIVSFPMLQRTTFLKNWSSVTLKFKLPNFIWFLSLTLYFQLSISTWICS